MSPTAVHFLYCLSLAVTIVNADVIFTSERCEREHYGLQIVNGDPSRYKQCGPSGRVWIVPCAPGMTFHPVDKVCRERQSSEVNTVSRKPASSIETVAVKAASPIEEEFTFSTRKPKRPRGKGKTRKPTTAPTESPMYASTPMYTSRGSYEETATYNPSNELLTLAPPSYAPSTGGVSEYDPAFSPAFTTPGQRYRITTTPPSYTEPLQTTRYVSLPSQSSEVTLQPQYTVKYNGMNLNEMDLIDRLMKLVDDKKKKSSLASFSPSELEIIEQRKQALLKQKHTEERPQYYEKTRENNKEKAMEAALMKERMRAENEKKEKERLIMELEAERSRQKEKLRQIQLEEEQRRQLIELEAERRLEEERRKRQEEERRRMEVEKLRVEEEQRLRELEEEHRRREIEEQERLEKLEQQRAEEQQKRLQLEKQRQDEQERLQKLENQRKEEQRRRELLELELARQEAARLENARLEDKRKEEAEKERKLREKQEQERLQKEKMEKEHLTREKLEREKAAQEMFKMEQQRQEMQAMLDKEKQFKMTVSTEESIPERPMFPQASLPGNPAFYKFSKTSNDLHSDPNIIHFTTPTPAQATLSQPNEPLKGWATSENSWRPPVQWISVDPDSSSETEHMQPASIPRVLSGCIINADCPFSYEEDTLCEHPKNPTAYLQCTPMLGRRGRWTERFCPDSLIFIHELARCEKLQEKYQIIQNGIYDPNQRVIIPNLSKEKAFGPWHGNGLNMEKGDLHESRNSIYESINNFPKDLITDVMTTTFPTIIPIQPMEYIANQYSSDNSIWSTAPPATSPMSPMMTDEIDLSILHPLFPRVQPNFLQRLIAPFTPMRDASQQVKDGEEEKPSTVTEVLKPVIKQIALDQTGHLLDRILSDEELKRSEKDILKST